MEYTEIPEQIIGDKLGGWSIEKKLFNWIIKNIPIGSTILELGSGYGTIELSKKYKMISIEHDKKWLNLCEESKYIYAPLKDNWYDVNILKNKLNGIKYDVILIDGPPKKVSNRFKLIQNISLFNKNIIWIIDDVNRNDEMKMCKLISNMVGRRFRIGRGERKDFAVIV